MSQSDGIISPKSEKSLHPAGYTHTHTRTHQSETGSTVKCTMPMTYLQKPMIWLRPHFAHSQATQSDHPLTAPHLNDLEALPVGVPDRQGHLWLPELTRTLLEAPLLDVHHQHPVPIAQVGWSTTQCPLAGRDRRPWSPRPWALVLRPLLVKLLHTVA